MTSTARQLTVKRLASALVLTSSMAGSFTLKALAQNPTVELRSPLIQGALNTPYGQAPVQGSPPPIGDGSTPIPVTPGMTGAPLPPPSAVSLPAYSPLQKATINSQLAPYLTPPPSTPGLDPGILPSVNGYAPDAAVVDLLPTGGLPLNSAPQQRRGGQATHDYGLVRTKGSQLTDFGQNLSIMSNLSLQPSFTQDGPRPINPLAGINADTRAVIFPNAQTTQDLYGNATNFKGPNLRPRQTIAPY